MLISLSPLQVDLSELPGGLPHLTAALQVQLPLPSQLASFRAITPKPLYVSAYRFVLLSMDQLSIIRGREKDTVRTTDLEGSRVQPSFEVCLD